jgi:fatty-acyl-CoA synthase
MGYLDDEGFLYLTGRKGQTIISGGVNIYPKEVENLLMQHDSIEDCFVFPLPDDEYGEIVAAGILLKHLSLPAVTAGEIITWCKIHGASVKAPKKVFFCTEIPRMATGKLAKADQDKLVQQFMS